MNDAERESIAKVVARTVREFLTPVRDDIIFLKSKQAELLKQIDLKSERGLDGPRGQPGEPGERGPAGRDGIDGERGAPGKDGSDGLEGKQGPPGDRGERGYTGPDGPPGRDGSDGKPGPRGECGERGEQGPRGEKGDRGETGRDGKDGRDGRDGIDGFDGRDAAQVEILEGIVDGRSYMRGTLATRDGGLWRFSGVEWQCIVDGVKELDVEQISERAFRICSRYSSGRTRESEFKVNSIIDRGVWEPKAYEIGDCVTYDGCMWIAKAISTEADKPGQSSAWRLSVKRGRNGKS